MPAYTAELRSGTGVSGFQTLTTVFCIYNKPRLHAEILRGVALHYGKIMVGKEAF